jgi:hypothetical protein
MKYVNRTPRCAHGFAVGIPGIRCSECRASMARRKAAGSGRPPINCKIFPGSVVGGSLILQRLSNDRIEAKCPCGETYEVSRSALSRNQRTGTIARCLTCRHKSLGMSLEAQAQSDGAA